MATQLFEGKDHASVYQKYRFSPQETVQEVILSYLEKKVRSLLKSKDVGVVTSQGAHCYPAGDWQKGGPEIQEFGPFTSHMSLLNCR